MSSIKPKYPPKRDVNAVRASLIKPEIKKKFKSLNNFRMNHFPDVKESAFRGWFFPPIHLSDDNLIKMENILMISKHTIINELGKNGITPFHLSELGIRLPE